MKNNLMLLIFILSAQTTFGQAKALNANIKDTTFDIIGLQINYSVSSPSIAGGYGQTINFKNQKSILIADKMKTRSVYYKKDTTFYKKINISFSPNKLKQIVNQIYTNSFIINVPLADTIKKINIHNKKKNTVNKDGFDDCGIVTCEDCSDYYLNYYIYTSKDTIKLSYDFRDDEMYICSSSVKSLRNWLFTYELVNLTTPNNIFGLRYFDKGKLNELIEWTKEVK